MHVTMQLFVETSAQPQLFHSYAQVSFNVASKEL